MCVFCTLMAERPHWSRVRVRNASPFIDYSSESLSLTSGLCSFCPRMRSTGPGGIKTTRRQSAPETLAASRRTKYPYGPPIWSERTPPSGRKWLRSGRNWAAAAASSANTRTASLTSETHVGQNQETES